MKVAISLVLIVLACSTSFVKAQTAYTINTKDTRINFNGNGASGSLNGLSGTINFDMEDLESSNFSVQFDMSTLQTDSDLKTKHAKGDSWFDVQKFPKATFVSKSVRKTSSGYVVVGDLTLHGITQSVSIPFIFDRMVFKGTFSLDRKDFGIMGPLFAFTVGDAFKVNATVPVNPQ